MYTVPQTSLTTAAGVGRRLSEGLGLTRVAALVLTFMFFLLPLATSV
jgi:hypothetical protein